MESEALSFKGTFCISLRLLQWSQLFTLGVSFSWNYIPQTDSTRRAASLELTWPTKAGRTGTENGPKEDIFMSLSSNFIFLFFFSYPLILEENAWEISCQY